MGQEALVVIGPEQIVQRVGAFGGIGAGSPPASRAPAISRPGRAAHLPAPGAPDDRKEFRSRFVMLLHQSVEQTARPSPCPSWGSCTFCSPSCQATPAISRCAQTVPSLDEALEELRRGDGAGIGAADILHIGDLGADHLVIERIKRQPPHPLAGIAARVAQPFAPACRRWRKRRHVRSPAPARWRRSGSPDR